MQREKKLISALQSVSYYEGSLLRNALFDYRYGWRRKTTTGYANRIICMQRRRKGCGAVCVWVCVLNMGLEENMSWEKKNNSDTHLKLCSMLIIMSLITV